MQFSEIKGLAFPSGEAVLPVCALYVKLFFFLLVVLLSVSNCSVEACTLLLCVCDLWW